MDPLSTTASIIAILQLSGKVLMHLSDVKDASKGRVRCTIETTNLYSLLSCLRFRLEEGHLNQPWYTAVRALAVENGPLDQFKEALEMLQSKIIDKGRLAKVGDALMWNFKKEEIASILDRIERLKSLVEIALGGDHLQLSRAIKDDTNYLRTQVLGIESHFDNVQLQQDSAKHRKLLDWISPTDYPTQQSTLIKERQEGTGQWFLNASEVMRWQSDSEATIFCPGIPGAGKTMVAAIAIDHLLRLVQSDSCGVAYVYCNYKVQHEQDVFGMLAAILKQLVQGKLSTIQHIEQLHKQHADRGTKPSVGDICNTLQAVLNHYPTVYIVIDALDECQESTRRQLLANLHDLRTGLDVRLMATSRFMPEIESSFEGALRLEIKATQEDVKRFVAGQLYSLPLCIRRDVELQELVQEKITEAVDGMFLLARLYIDSLRDKRRVKEVKLALAELPKGEEGLSKAYEDAFQRIETQMPGDRELAKKVLSWITLAKHPMTTTEICCALAVEPNESEIDPDNIPDSEDLQSVCAGLLVVDEKSTIIRLVHYTTQEYLEQTVDTWCPDGQLHIATTCLSYLALDVFQDDECYKPRKLATTLTRHPFLSYASKYWGHHAKVVEAEIIQVACAVRLRTAISCAGRFNRGSTIIHYLARFGLINMMKIVLSTPDEPGIMEIDVKDDHERTPLSYAAEYGYYEVVKFLLDKGVNANTEGGFYGTALQAASVGGHKQVVELLLDNGAEVDAKAGHYDIALHAASANGHEQVVELLLERGADIKAQDNDGYTALHAASDYGHEQITRLLLDRGVEINAQDKDGFTALHAVSEYGYEQLAKLLLDKGAEVNVQDLDGYTALHVALAEGHEQIIKLLLDRRAEVNVQGNGCADALQKASSRNHEQAVKLVLEAGADVSSKGPYHGIILHGFASWGNSQMVELLLAKGAEVDWHTENYASPLYIASEQDHGQVAEVLLKARADPNIQCGKHGNALFAASVHGYEDLVELLLENGADANAEGAIYPNSPLYAASSKGYAYIVSLLIKHGAKVNTQEGYYGNALFAASINDYASVVKLLLENGADPDAQGTKYNNTPLYAASSQGLLRVVEALVENKANVNAQGGYYGNALLAASMQEHEQVVQLLLDHGADLHAQGTMYYSTPLYEASSRGLWGVVKLLVENGANVNAQEGRWGNALAAASMGQHERVAKLLLDNGAESTQKLLPIRT